MNSNKIYNCFGRGIMLYQHCVNIYLHSINKPGGEKKKNVQQTILNVLIIDLTFEFFAQRHDAISHLSIFAQADVLLQDVSPPIFLFLYVESHLLFC